jgi:hypothetical protein
VQLSQEPVYVLEQVGQSLSRLFTDLLACWHPSERIGTLIVS